MSISDTILKLQNRDKEFSVEQYNEEIERLVRNDQRIRVIPYWYPYHIYNYQTNCDDINKLVENAWYEKRHESDDVAIYLHVPFCKQKCGYCQWYTIVRPEDEYEVYTKLIIKEIDMYSKIINLSGKRVKSIYFGGGTPNLLSLDQITRIANKIHEHFDTSQVEEFSMEAFPDFLDDNYIAGLKKLGFNRISMGVQTFDNLALANDYKRRISEAQAKYMDMINNIKENNMMFCIDMLADLPNQSFNRIKRDFDEVLEIMPDQIAYAYAEYRNAPIKSEADKMPGYLNRKSCYFHASNRLAAAGYQQIDDMMFTKKGTPLFWVDLRTLASVEIAFGPRGRGYAFDGSAYMNGDYNFWKERIDNDQYPVWALNKLSDEDMILKYLITGVYYGRIDLDEFKNRFGSDVGKVLPNMVSSFINTGLVTERDYSNSCIDYYNYMGRNDKKINILELTEMGKHYVEVMRILLADKKYKRRIRMEQLADKKDVLYRELCKNIL